MAFAIFIDIIDLTCHILTTLNETACVESKIIIIQFAIFRSKRNGFTKSRHIFAVTFKGTTHTGCILFKIFVCNSERLRTVAIRFQIVGSDIIRILSFQRVPIGANVLKCDAILIARNIAFIKSKGQRAIFVTAAVVNRHIH